MSSVDLTQNEEANANVLISNSDSMVAQEREVIDGISKILSEDSKFDAIICVAGGWAGGSAKNKGFYLPKKTRKKLLIVLC